MARDLAAVLLKLDLDEKASLLAGADLWSSVAVRIPVTNTGERGGSEVVQLYVASNNPGAFRPVKELKGFAKVALGPGESTVVSLRLDDRSFARWADPDPDLDELVQRLRREVFWTRPPRRVGERGWIIDPGPYEIHVGRSSADIAHVIRVAVPSGGPLAADGR
jgi:beta-glucosidase